MFNDYYVASKRKRNGGLPDIGRRYSLDVYGNIEQHIDAGVM